MVGNVDRATAAHINGQPWKQEDGKEQVFEGIVGRSPGLQRAFREVEAVAPTDSGVLILFRAESVPR